MNIRSRKIAIAGLFGAIAGALTPLVAYTTAWGFNVDFIAIPWIICYLLFDFEITLLSMGVSWPIISLLDADGGFVIGATTKLVASIWMIFIPEVIRRFHLLKIKEKNTHTIAGMLLGTVVRMLVMVVFNLYVAIPLFYGMSVNDAAQYVVGVSEWFLGSLSSSVGVFWTFVIIIMFWNGIQGILEIAISLPVAEKVKKSLFE